MRICTDLGKVGLVEDGLRMLVNVNVIWVFDGIFVMLLVSFIEVVLIEEKVMNCKEINDVDILTDVSWLRSNYEGNITIAYPLS